MQMYIIGTKSLDGYKLPLIIENQSFLFDSKEKAQEQLSIVRTQLQNKLSPNFSFEKKKFWFLKFWQSPLKINVFSNTLQDFERQNIIHTINNLEVRVVSVI